MERDKITLPPDIFHYIHLCSLAFGGIGAGSDFKRWTFGVHPQECNCAIGFFMAIPLVPMEELFGEYKKLVELGFTRRVNDSIVSAVNIKKYASLSKIEVARHSLDRITFEEWCAEGNIHCGEN